MSPLNPSTLNPKLVAEKCKDPLFTKQEVDHMRTLWEQWSAETLTP